MIGLRSGPQFDVLGSLRDLEIGGIHHHDGSEQPLLAKIAIKLEQPVAPARVIVDRLWIGRAEKPVRFEHGPKRVVTESITVAADVAQQIEPPSLAAVDRRRATVRHAEPGLRHDIDDAAKPVPVLGWESTGHHVRRVNHIGTETRREHRVRVLPKCHAVDQRVERHLFAAHMHEIVVPANHTRRRRHDGIW